MDGSHRIGEEITVPISVEEDEERLQEDALDMRLNGDIEEEEEGEDSAATQAACADRLNSEYSKQLTNGREGNQVRKALRRMRVALTRTDPTVRSCQARLALADWLHRRLRQARLRTDDHTSLPDYSKSRVHFYRTQVASQGAAAAAETVRGNACGCSLFEPCKCQVFSIDGSYTTQLVPLSPCDATTTVTCHTLGTHSLHLFSYFANDE